MTAEIALLSGLSPSPPSSLTHVHRCIGDHNPNWHSLSKSVRLTYLSVYDNRDSVSEPVLSPSPPSSITHIHRWIGYRNTNWHSLSNSHMYTGSSVIETQTDSLSNSVRLTYLSVYDNRNSDSETTLSPCLSKSVRLTYLSVYDTRDSSSESTHSVWQLHLVCESLQFPRALTLRLSEHRHLPSSPTNFRFIRCDKLSLTQRSIHSPITHPKVSSINLVFIFKCSSSPWNPVYGRHVDPSVLTFSLSSYRHPHICIPCRHRFIYCSK